MYLKRLLSGLRKALTSDTWLKKLALLKRTDLVEKDSFVEKEHKHAPEDIVITAVPTTRLAIRCDCHIALLPVGGLPLQQAAVLSD